MSSGVVFTPAGATKRIAPMSIADTTVARLTNMAASGSHEQPRKRRRLNHLTPEEKAMRRKLKNRVAAQTARDRKKAKMDELEVLVAKLEAQNKALKDQNTNLKQQSNSLKTENMELKKRLGLAEQSAVQCKQERMETSTADDRTTGREGSRSSESAAFRLSASLQQGQIWISSSLVAWILTLSAMSSSASWSNWTPTTSSPSSARTPTASRPPTRPSTPRHQPRLAKPWGPQHHAWNPLQN